MTKQVTVEELEQHLRERLEEVQNGETLCITAGNSPIAQIAPLPPRAIEVVRHDPALHLRDFTPGRASSRSDSVDWLIGERERERSGKKHGS